jgi:hypothetical protein
MRRNRQIAHRISVETQVSSSDVEYIAEAYLWPEFEVNHTWWRNGERENKTQVFLTPSLIIGRIPVHERIGILRHSAIRSLLAIIPPSSSRYFDRLRPVLKGA